MTDPMTIGKEMQGQILETIRQSQDAVTDAIRTWANAIHSIAPALPIPSVPLVDKLPKPGDLVANAYDFAEQLLAAQRKFTEEVLQVTAPLFTTEQASAPKKAATAAK